MLILLFRKYTIFMLKLKNYKINGKKKSHIRDK